MKGNSTIKGSRGELILEIGGSHEDIRQKVKWDMHLNQYYASDVKELKNVSVK